MIIRKTIMLAMASALVLTVGCGPKKKAEKKDDDPQVAQSGADNSKAEEIDESNFSEDTMTWLKDSYEKAKAAGEKVPSDVKAWAREDVKKIGAWDYKIVTFTTEATTESIQEELQSLGNERWNCFFVEVNEGGRIFYLKKSKRSYLQAAGKLSRLIPLPGGDGGQD